MTLAFDAFPRPFNVRRRLLMLSAVAPAVLGALVLSGCQKPGGPTALSRGEVKDALAVLDRAPEQGFAPGAFGERGIGELINSPKAAEQAEGSRRLQAALIAYAGAEHGLRIPHSALPADWGLKPEPYDAEAALFQALKAGTFKAWLADLPPPSPDYQALQQAYVAYLKLSTAGGWPAVPAGGALKLGAHGPRVLALRQRLGAEDPGAAGPADAPYDAALAGAVGRFQTAHGLAPTGVVDAATTQELNVPAQARAAQIRANLERLRWLPRVQPATRIDVNTAAATMDYFVDNRLTTHMLAASGKPGDETPMLRSAVDGIVLNPPWNVPETIATKELLPKEAADPGYLERKGFTTKEGAGGPRLVQEPSADSALGLVKFEFDNPYAVYLHDTPSKAAFAKTQRAVSHGCVRLERAVDFAKLLLSTQPGWSAGRVDEVLASGETVHVKLSHPVAVRLMYRTAFPEGGRIAFRPDIYGWDTQLLQLLDHPPAPKPSDRRTKSAKRA
ncbi:murein L,D-transpeptidase [Phenylobacterium hankyongense]|uniref:Murein L,D-transpeptidase n=1 Tax=Phenylobacterium hankyongense TaxID=1813876 RepID=A0A328AZ11_9CAUL|nr:L,D-transpeptidase family protein [Phenylobacterium hankyongense]RAK59535.1 murein L,D-transpeptidase [Phenylobacterium hankyongense]